MTSYQERKCSSGDLHACDYSKLAKRGDATHTGSGCVVVPETSDFIADVELAALKSLTAPELRYFQVFYASGKVVVLTQHDINEAKCDWQLEQHIASVPDHLQARYRAMDTRVRTTLGERFMASGISPTSVYFRPTDVRDLKGAA